MMTEGIGSYDMRKVIFAVAIAMAVAGAGLGVLSVFAPTAAIAKCTSRC
jgi:hypothetical protein